MGKIKLGRIQFPDFGNGFMPGFDVQLRRNKRRNGRAVSEPDTGDIAAEQIIFPMINVMMTGMARCGDGADFELAYVNNVLVLQNSDALLRDRRDLAPQSLHVVAEDTARRCNQFGGIDEMLSATRMNVNRGSKLGEAPSRTGVVKMDMTEEDVLNIVSGSTKLAKRGDDIVKGRFGTGIEKDKAIAGFQRRRGDDARPGELNGVEDVNFQRAVITSYRLTVISYQLSVNY